MTRSWYDKIVRDQGDPDTVTKALDYYAVQHAESCAEMDTLRGRRLIEAETMLPGIVGYRYEQLQELESIMDYLQIREDGLLGVKRRHYIEHYNRVLSDRMVENFTESDSDVIASRELRNHVAAVRNKFIAMSRQHEYLHYQLNNITQLRKAGLDDAIL